MCILIAVLELSPHHCIEELHYYGMGPAINVTAFGSVFNVNVNIFNAPGDSSTFVQFAVLWQFCGNLFHNQAKLTLKLKNLK